MTKKKTGKSETTQVTQLKSQLTEVEAKWKRALADYQNLEKRTANNQSLYVKLASVTLIEKLLPILDDLKRAAKHINDEGLHMVLKQFQTLLKSEGVTTINAQAQTFDPQLMECVEMVAGEANTVAEVLEDGYQIGDTVIRPAKVKVGKG